MHQSSRENMQKCFDRYLWGSALMDKEQIEVLDVGGAEVNGSYSDIFCGDKFVYLGADLQPGPGVSVVLSDPNKLPLEDRSVDIVVSGQMLEHCANFWLVFAEMMRVLTDDGYLFLIAPSAGPIHRYPVDCYRFYPDAFGALADYANCYLVDHWLDDRGPWNDLVGVFSRGRRPKISRSQRPFEPARQVNDFLVPDSSQSEPVRGESSYLDLLGSIHATVQPETYLEIGVRQGRSLALASCTAVGVDPYPDLTVSLGSDTRVVRQPSDEFFELGEDPVLSAQPDLVFIDGMHLFEYVLRDFINTEAICKPETVVVVDDVFPNSHEQAFRERKTRVWTGDVWKLLPVLRQHRPDLELTLVDTHPTGTLIISGLNPRNRVLRNRYNGIVRQYVTEASTEVPSEILDRVGAVDPNGPELAALFTNGAQDPGPSIDLNQRPSSTLSGPSTPEVSVVVVSYNMQRELPRTLHTLRNQSGIAPEQAEILVVDNGSTDAVDLEALESMTSNVTVLRAETGSRSPVGAINLGLAKARAPFVGVMIDGARMASPGMLSQALEANSLHQRAVIGTIAFHLGPKVQMESVKEGYDQEQEDRLLADVDWEQDGYRLFDISALAGSSAGGWLRLPAETNALFMNRELWDELGGYDPAFQTAGGGYANLDTWKRACELEEAQVVMLLGEATFHQVHGGVATNSTESPQREFQEEYRRIRGTNYEVSQIQPLFHGRFHHEVRLTA